MTPPTVTQVYARLIAAMIKHKLPDPEYISVKFVQAGWHVCAFVTLPDSNVRGVNRWISALGLPPATDDPDFDTFIAYGTETVGGDRSAVLGCHAHVSTFIPTDAPKPDLPAEDRSATELILATAHENRTEVTS